MAKGRKTGGRKPGTPNRNATEKRSAREDFFSRIVSDKEEMRLWNHFMTAAEPNIVNWHAFKRAVEYKRGMPVQQHAGPEGGPIAVEFVTNVRFPSSK